MEFNLGNARAVEHALELGAKIDQPIANKLPAVLALEAVENAAHNVEAHHTTLAIFWKIIDLANLEAQVNSETTLAQWLSNRLGIAPLEDRISIYPSAVMLALSGTAHTQELKPKVEQLQQKILDKLGLSNRLPPAAPPAPPTGDLIDFSGM